jgi:uridine phosphorylase
MDGTAVTVVATGSGAPELELALVEIMEHSDAEVVVYFGTAAGLHPFVNPGDVVISSGVVREDGLSAAYVERGYPAAPSYDVVAAFVTAAQTVGASYRVGVTRSTDSDMLGNGRPSVGGYMQPRHAETIDYWVRAGVLTNDREASPVVTLGNLFGRRTGVVVGCTDNFPSGKTLKVGAGMEDAARVLVEGLRTLARFDAERTAADERHWAPRT